MKHLKYLIFYLLLSTYNLNAQSNNYIPNITVTTPQVASMNKVSEIPVDLATGKMNYNIPIFEIKEGSFTMPINLSYNYSGLLLDETPGYAGVGWTLNIGGAIMHSINGLNDEDHFEDKGFLDKYINKLPPYDDETTPAGRATRDHFLNFIADGVFDGEPDKYTINIGNINCSFYLDKNNNPIFVKNENYKISGYAHSGFTLTDDKGINYIFSLPQGVSKVTDSSQDDYYSSFLITEINFPFTTNKIKFEYSNSTSYTETYKSQSFTKTTNQLGNPDNDFSLQTNTTYSNLATSKLTKITTDSYSIDLHYTNNPQEPAIAVISNLQIKNKLNTTIKNYDFEFSPWTDRRTNLLNVKCNGVIINEMEYDMSIPYPSMNSTNYYLKRDLWGYYNENAVPVNYGSISITSNPSVKPHLASTKIGSLKKITYQTKGYSLIEYEPNTIHTGSSGYNFPYKSDATTSTMFSATTSANESMTVEKTFVVTTVPAEISILSTLTNHTQINPYEDRSTSVILYKEGEISNPKYSAEQYWYREANWIPGELNFTATKKISIGQAGTYYIKAVSTQGSSASLKITLDQLPESFNEIVGGIRVKQIQNCDFDGKCITTTYNYNQSGKSSGIMLQSPKFYSGYFIEDNTDCNGTYYRRDYYNFSSIHPLTMFRNSPVLYKIVEKSDVDGISNNGKTIFSFYGDSFYIHDESSYIMTGLSSGTHVKNEADNSITNYKSSYARGTYRENPKYIYALECKEVKKTTFIWENNNCAVGYPRFSGDFRVEKYKHEARNYFLEKEEKTRYFNGQQILESTFNSYNVDTGNLKSQTTTNSQSQNLETKYFYPTDSEMAAEPLRDELIAVNMIGTPLEVQSYNANKLSDQKTVYAKDASTANLVLPKYVYANKGADVIDTLKDKKVTYNQYDDKGNILQYTQESGTPVSIIWGYNKTQPIAKIENAAYSEVVSYISNLQAKSDTGTEAALLTDLNSLRTNLPNAMVTTYTHIPLVGVSTITDPKGDKMTYTYDTFGRLQFVKDKNLNILQKYCYNYKGQQIDCDIAFAGSTSYKSMARSGSFTKNNCAAGTSGSNVTYNQAEGAVTSTVSQADADALGLSKFNTDGQANANTNGTCTTPLPAAPTGLTFTSATATSLNFSWTAVAGATSYKIYKNGSDTGITSSTNTGSLSGLTASTAYSIQVKAVNAAGDSPLSTAVSMTTASAPISNSCSLNFNRLAGSCTLLKNGSSYLTRSTSGTSSGTFAAGDTFSVTVYATSTYYKSINITSSVRGTLYDYGPSTTGSSVTSPTFTKTGSEVITINCSTDNML
nr:DUF5977 domain-containing protein [uncultured Flavobacterium sp.]